MPEMPLIIHDFIRFNGGGERVVTALAEDLNWPLVVGEKRDSDSRAFSIEAPANAPFYLNFSRILQFQWGFENLLPRKFSEKKLVIFSGSLSLLGWSGFQNAKKILYCHTPPRLIYDMKKDYFAREPFWRRPALHLIVRHYQRAYEKAFRQMELVIANSENIRKRIKKYLGVDSVVVHPPCETEKFNFLGQEDYYLSTARIDPLKRVDMVVEAFLKMPDKKLVVVSGGPDLPEIKKLAQGAPNIEILGWVSDLRLRELIGRCIATIYIPRDEDFGISPVESMAAGKPVIGVAEGGLPETVIGGETGILIPPGPTVEHLRDAAREMTPQLALRMRKACEGRARMFGRDIFVEKMRQVIGDW